MAKTIRVKLVKSTIGSDQKQKDTVLGLGLRRINHVRELENTASVRGMIRRVQHLLEIVQD